MKKPKSRTYYDCWEVIRYIKDKHKLSQKVADNFFKWFTDRFEIRQNSLVHLYIDEYLPHHDEYPCDEYCPCKSVPEEIRNFLSLIKEIEEKEISLKIWW